MIYTSYIHVSKNTVDVLEVDLIKISSILLDFGGDLAQLDW